MRFAPAIASLLAFLCLSGLALGAEPVPIHDGDRVAGTLSEPEAEIGLVLDALEGTVLDLKIKGDPALRPEIRLYDPEDAPVEVGPSSRRSSDGRKARVKRLTLPATGRYTVVVRAAGTGGFRLRVRADHPRKVKGQGRLAMPGASTHLRFPAFAGTVARPRLGGRSGLLPVASSLLEPDVTERPLEDVEASAFDCPEHGDYRLVIEGRAGTTGDWKGKVKLTHPTADPRNLVADGEPAGAFTDEMTEPPPDTDPVPTGPLTWRVLDSGTNSSVSVAKNLVCRTDAEFWAMWREHRPPMPPGVGAPQIGPPPFDLSKETVVAIFLGPRTWQTRVRVIAVTRVPGGIQVTTLEVPQSGAALCQPYEIITVSPPVKGTVTFAQSIAWR